MHYQRFNLPIFQISAAKGPAECEQAVKYTLSEIQKDAQKHHIKLEILEKSNTQFGYTTVLLQVESNHSSWLNTWCGTIQWTFKSQIRPNHKRKNWFIGITQFEIPTTLPEDNTIIFQACRASGAGGQHVNTTDSAIHAIHIATGISVKVMSERSQHANKRLAKALIALKLQQHIDIQIEKSKQTMHKQHALIERGNPIKCFKK